MGVEGDNYSNLLGQHFRDSISGQMNKRRFTKSASPQLQVNVSIDAEDKVRVNTYQDPYLYGGYYGRGYGGYGGYYGGMGYPYGGGTRTTVHQYTQAKVYIDMVDSQEHKLVWQGVATFTVTDKLQENLRQTVNDTVDKISLKSLQDDVAIGAISSMRILASNDWPEHRSLEEVEALKNRLQG